MALDGIIQQDGGSVTVSGGATKVQKTGSPTENGRSLPRFLMTTEPEKEDDQDKKVLQRAPAQSCAF
jgi:hypothetical protein